ncbi:ATPase, T2SS/T4P/T4SS family, partial [Pseudomonas sp. SIMBA_064]
GINILNTGATNISTAEDPVEINLEGINQVNVNPKVGLTFANALKSFLRQDPDIVMVGRSALVTMVCVAALIARVSY